MAECAEEFNANTTDGGATVTFCCGGEKGHDGLHSAGILGHGANGVIMWPLEESAYHIKLWKKEE